MKIYDYLSKKVLHEAISLHGHGDKPIITDTLTALKKRINTDDPSVKNSSTSGQVEKVRFQIARCIFTHVTELFKQMLQNVHSIILLCNSPHSNQQVGPS